MKLEETFLRRARELIPPGSGVTVALSGGADSVALLALLRACSDTLGLRLSAAHFHHGLRGPEADRDEAFFTDHELVLILLEEGSGSIDHEITDVLPGPDGVTVATNEYDEMMFTLTSRAHSSHTVSANRLGNGDYRVVVSSLSAKTFSGTEGVIMNVTLSVDNNQVAGDYEVKLFSIVLNTADNVSIKPNGMTATLSLSDVAPGDVNGDGSINVTDVGMVIDHILEHTPAGFIAEAADINGDGDINVTDVGLIIDIILSDNSAREVLMKENVKKSVEEIHEPQ